MQAPPIHEYDVQLVTPAFHARGRLNTIGYVLDFLNDPGRDALILTQAHVASLKPGGPIRAMSIPRLSVRKQEVALLYLLDEEARAQIRLLPRREPTIVYTPLAILRGEVPLSAEARSEDMLATSSAVFIIVTAAHVFFLTQLTTALPQQTDVLLVGRQHIQMYHPA